MQKKGGAFYYREANYVNNRQQGQEKEGGGNIGDNLYVHV